eukprot:1107672-Rhodomonas_salina.2
MRLREWYAVCGTESACAARAARAEGRLRQSHLRILSYAFATQHRDIKIPAHTLSYALFGTDVSARLLSYACAMQRPVLA